MVQPWPLPLATCQAQLRLDLGVGMAASSLAEPLPRPCGDLHGRHSRNMHIM